MRCPRRGCGTSDAPSVATALGADAAELTLPGAGARLHVSISLDAAYAARTRYSNRIDEQVQFNAADPAKLPHAVPGVGDHGAYNQNATWIPAYSTLWAVRGNRWLTVVYSTAGTTPAQRLAAVAPLARLAFRLTAR